MKRGNKKGQVYLMAAIIIAVALSGLVGVTTYSSSNIRQRTIENLASELREESARVVEYGLYNGADMNDFLTQFIDNKYGPYFLKKTDSTGIFFIYGNEDELYGAQYKQEHTGTIYTGFGNMDTSHNYLETTQITPNLNGEIIVTLLDDDEEYAFKLQDNEMFYFIIIQEKDGEKYIERN
jgi:hypothetical protein